MKKAAREMVRGRMSKRVNEKKVNGSASRRERAARAEIRTTIDFYRENRSGRESSAGSRSRAARGKRRDCSTCSRPSSARPWKCSIRFDRSAMPPVSGGENSGPAYAMAVGLAMRMDDDR